jgi:hypothetical protein
MQACAWAFPFLVAVAEAAGRIHQGARLEQSLQGPLGTYGMPPCKRCGTSRLHSRDELLDTDDGDLTKMKDDLSKEVEDLDKELKEQKETNAAELGKLKKRLSDMDAAYAKFGKETVARTAKFTKLKAANSKKLDSSLEGNAKTQTEIKKVYESLEELRTFVTPYVEKFITGGCKCSKAKALLMRLQAEIRVVGIGAEIAADTPVRSQALLRKSAKVVAPDQEKYKLVRAVQQLEEKRAKLMQDRAADITDFSQKQRLTLDRIDAARIKAGLKANTEKKYEESDKSLEKVLKASAGAAARYLDNSETQLKRLQDNEKKSLKIFASFKAELQKCKCL